MPPLSFRTNKKRCINRLVGRCAHTPPPQYKNAGHHLIVVPQNKKLLARTKIQARSFDVEIKLI